MTAATPITLSFLDHLSINEASEGRKRKGERTRDALRRAAIASLEEHGYHSSRLTEICERASIAPGSFYAYYEDRRALMLDVVHDFIDFAYERLFVGEAHEERSAFDAIYASNLRWLSLVRSNTGLMRCVLQLSDDEPAFARRYEQVSHRLHHAVAVGMLRRLGKTDGLSLATLIAYALGSMMDEVARRLLVHPNGELGRLVELLCGDDEALAEVLAVIWYRSIYGRDPEGVRTPVAIAAIDMSR